MDIKDLIICPHCGRSYFSSFKHDHYKKTLFENEDITTPNFNDDNYSTYLDNLFKSYTREETNINNNVITPVLYSVTNFNFFIGKKKANTNIIIEPKRPKIIKFNSFKFRKKLGRKTKRDSKSSNNESKKYFNPETHDKFREDNLRKKSKNIIMKNTFEFINNKLKTIYKDDIGQGDLKKELKILDQKNNKSSTFKSDKAFLEKRLIDIFSQKISKRCCNFSSDHNKKIIELLINENDEEKRDYFTKLFNITFSDCLKYFIGEKNIIELEGMKVFSSIKDELMKESGEKYVSYLMNYLQNYEESINKRSKKIDKK